jgi:hypothetical protein
MGFDCHKIRQGFCDYTGSVSGVTELEIFFNHTFDYFCNCIRLVAALITMGVAFLYSQKVPLLVV